MRTLSGDANAAAGRGRGNTALSASKRCGNSSKRHSKANCAIKVDLVDVTHKITDSREGILNLKCESWLLSFTRYLCTVCTNFYAASIIYECFSNSYHA